MLNNEETLRDTRSVVNDYFQWRLTGKSHSDDPLAIIVRRIAKDCERVYQLEDSSPNLSCVLSMDLAKVKYLHHQIGKDLFENQEITWTKIMSFISFAAMLAEQLIHHDELVSGLIISSLVSWTTEFIDTELRDWLKAENYWVSYSTSASRM